MSIARTIPSTAPLQFSTEVQNGEQAKEAGARYRAARLPDPRRSRCLRNSPQEAKIELRERPPTHGWSLRAGRLAPPSSSASQLLFRQCSRDWAQMAVSVKNYSTGCNYP